MTYDRDGGKKTVTRTIITSGDSGGRGMCLVLNRNQLFVCCGCYLCLEVMKFDVASNSADVVVFVNTRFC